MRSSLGSVLDLDDAVGHGCLGLINAAERYDPRKGVTFSSFAAPFIRGAVLDAIRKLDALSRLQRRQIRTIERAQWELANQLGRWPTLQELALRVGLPAKELKRLETSNLFPVQVEELSSLLADEDESLEPEHRIESMAGKERLREALSSLPRRDYLILCLYYWKGLPFRTIGTCFGISESRVSQLHRRILAQLREELREAA